MMPVVNEKRITNPFPGLRPFETDEYRLFFGREGQSDALIARLQRSRFLAIVGTSGSGKSSLVRAGLLPALRGGMMAGAGSGWRITIMRPGSDPIGNLAEALADKDVLLEAGGGLPAAEAEAVIEATLRRGSLGLVDVAKQARLAEHEKLLVVVDQFEELFRFRSVRAPSSTGDDAAAFVKLLIEAAQQRELEIYIVPTMRSDFLGDCAQFQGLPEAINDGQYLIPRMTRDERRFAITGPVGVTRGKITEPLVNRLMNDVGDNPDQLPILQHALMRTWDYWSAHARRDEPIGLEHYEAIGTMSDALSQHADEAYNELPDERSRQVAEILFKALTERGADNREIRRPTSLRDICAIAAASVAEVVAVIDIFRGGGRSFLMPPLGSALKPETVIDISHESLIRNWRRLRDWVRDEAESARIYRRLAGAALDYRAGAGGLLDDVTLQYVLKWRERANPDNDWAARYNPEFADIMAYLEESRAAHDARILAEQERERRELETAQLYAEQQRRAAQRLRGYTLALIVISILAVTAAGVSVLWFYKAKGSEAHALAAQKEAEALAGKLSNSGKELAEKNKTLETEKATAVTLAEKLKQEKLKTDNALAAQKLATEHAEKQRAAARAAETDAINAKTAAVRDKERLQASMSRSASHMLGVAAFQRTDFGDAMDWFKRALSELDIEEKLMRTAPAPSKPGEQDLDLNNLAYVRSSVLAHLGATQRELGQFEEAVKSYEEAAKHQRDIRSAATKQGLTLGKDVEWGLFDAVHGLAHAYHDLADKNTKRSNSSGSPLNRDKADYDAAEKSYTEAMALQEDILKGSQPARLASAYENLARVHTDMDELAKAEEDYKPVVAIREKNPEDPEYVRIFKQLAQFYVGQNRYEEALKQYEKVLAVQEEAGFNGETHEGTELRAMADSYSSVGEIYSGLNDEPKSKAYFQLARKVQDLALRQRQIERLLKSSDTDEDDMKRLADLKIDDDLLELGKLFESVGRFTQAQSCYGAALVVAEGNDTSQANIQMTRGHLYRFQLKDYGQAADSFENAVALLQVRTDSLRQLADAQTQLGGVYTEDLDKPAEAEQLLKSALDNLAKSDDPGQATYETLSVLADLYRRQKNNTDLVKVSRQKLSVAGHLLEQTTPRNVAQKAWNPNAYAEAFGLYVQAVSDLSDAFKSAGDSEASKAVFASLLDEKLDVDQVVDEKVVGAYAALLESHSDDIQHLVMPPAAKGNVTERIKSARAKQNQIKVIKAGYVTLGNRG